MSYESALLAAGVEVLEFEYFGSYQGDWLALIIDNDVLGVAEGCYGSCSYCDAFESEFGYDYEGDDYQERLADNGTQDVTKTYPGVYGPFEVTC